MKHPLGDRDSVKLSPNVVLSALRRDHANAGVLRSTDFASEQCGRVQVQVHG